MLSYLTKHYVGMALEIEHIKINLNKGKLALYKHLL